MIQIADQTLEEKRKIYRKLSKPELIDMLIEANRQLSNLTSDPRVVYNAPQKVPYHELCGCTVCNCTMGNHMVDVNGRGEYVQTTNVTTS